MLGFSYLGAYTDHNVVNYRIYDRDFVDIFWVV